MLWWGKHYGLFRLGYITRAHAKACVFSTSFSFRCERDLQGVSNVKVMYAYFSWIFFWESMKELKLRWILLNQQKFASTLSLLVFIVSYVKSETSAKITMVGFQQKSGTSFYKLLVELKKTLNLRIVFVHAFRLSFCVRVHLNAHKLATFSSSFCILLALFSFWFLYFISPLCCLFFLLWCVSLRACIEWHHSAHVCLVARSPLHCAALVGSRL